PMLDHQGFWYHLRSRGTGSVVTDAEIRGLLRSSPNRSSVPGGLGDPWLRSSPPGGAENPGRSVRSRSIARSRLGQMCVRLRTSHDHRSFLGSRPPASSADRTDDEGDLARLSSGHSLHPYSKGAFCGPLLGSAT